jgi:hypothetical protein
MEEDLMASEFLGPKNGVGYSAGDLLKSSEMNSDFTHMLMDLDDHVEQMQSVYDKLDTVELNASADPSTLEIVNDINASLLRLSIDNMDITAKTYDQLNAYIESHRVASTHALKHPAINVNGHSGTYTDTPTTLVTSATRTLQDELNNIRYIISLIINKSLWVSVPDATILNMYDTINTLARPVLKVGIQSTTVGGITMGTSVNDCCYVVDAASDTTMTLPEINSDMAGRIFMISNLSSNSVYVLHSGSDDFEFTSYNYYTISSWGKVILMADNNFKKWRRIL